MRYEQSSTVPPLAKSEADSDLFDAARDRAENFWKYNAEANWYADVELPNAAGKRSGKVIQVQSCNGKLSVVHR